MDRKLKELLKENNLLLKFMPLHTKGCIVHNTEIIVNDKKVKVPNTIVLNSNLSNDEITRVVLHELGHYKYDDTVLGDYKDNRITKFCSECNANRFMIREMIKYWISLGHDIETINYVNLAHYIGVKDPMIVKEELAEYL